MSISTVRKCAKLSDILRKLSDRIHYQQYAEQQR